NDLPRIISLISGTRDYSYPALGSPLCCAGNYRGFSVQGALVIVHGRVIKRIIAQRRTDDICPRTVGTFGRKQPVVFFDAVFARHSLSNVQVERSAIRSPDIDVGYIASDNG